MNQPEPHLGLIATDNHPAVKISKSIDAQLRIAFFGTNGAFSHRVLSQLDSEALDICAIFCDASDPFQPHLAFDLHRLEPPPPLGPEIEEIRLHTDSTVSTSTIIDIGWQLNIPVYSIGRIRSRTVNDTLEALKVDIVCVVCFNKRIPPSLLAIPRFGFLNLHPSMLPDYRGPEPLQWILHDGAQGGITIHWMDEDFDTGDIAYQEAIDFMPGTDYYVAERICADIGLKGYMHVLGELSNGNVPRTPQVTGGFYRGRLGSQP